MDGATLLDRLRADYESELSRLASSKALYALTGGEMDAASVRAATAADAAAAAGTFEDWTDGDDGPAGDLFARAAAEAAAHREAVAGDEDAGGDADPYPIYDALATAEGAPARLGGLLARSLLASDTVGQAVGFFVGDANPTAADEFRGVRREIESLRDDAAAALDDACDDEDDWTAAEATARTVVEAAYEAYVDRLESMGIKPKNVC